ncbi:MAG: DJ-1/PfpI family protein [Clostridia bacterium]|nr:DJ-1/PfpI family protein [Clostridia bacterium]
MVYLFLADGFEEIEALYTLDILRRASINIKTVGVTGKTATGSHKIPVICDIAIQELSANDDFDMIILPGGLPGAYNLDDSEAVSNFIEIAHKNNKFICAICAAPFILGKRGILKGKKATCFPGFENELAGAEIQNCGCVRDGNIITARAMGSAHEFALEILKALSSPEASDKMKKAIILN